MSISASHTSPMAGELCTLTCTVTSDIRPQMTWLGPNEQPVNGTGITLSPQSTNGLVSTVEITFSSLHTSHSGTYTCISTIHIHDPPSRRKAVHLLTVESKDQYSCSILM